MFLFADDTYFVAEENIFTKILARLVLFLHIIGYPLSKKKFWVNQVLVWVGFTVDLHVQAAAIFEVKRRLILEKLVTVLADNWIFDKMEILSLVGSLQWASQLCLPLRPFLAGLYSFVATFMSTSGSVLSNRLREELALWELFLSAPRVIRPLATTPKPMVLRIFTDACAQSPFEESEIKWDSGMGVGGFMLTEDVDDIARAQWFAFQIDKTLFPWLAPLKQPSRLINFLELTATYVAVRLWAKTLGRENDDQLWVDLPISSDNAGNVFIINKMFTNARPLAWMLHEIAAFSIANNVRILATHRKGDADKYTDLADKLSRGLTTLSPEHECRPRIYDENFWCTNIRSKPEGDLAALLSLKDKKRWQKQQRLAKGGKVQLLKRLPKSLRAKRKQSRRLRELQISLQVNEELSQLPTDQHTIEHGVRMGELSKQELELAKEKWKLAEVK